MPNKEAIQVWADELRYGNYGQTYGSLIEEEGDKYLFCGLGVACNAYAKQHGMEVMAVRLTLDSNLDVLPPLVAEWLGIDKSIQGDIVGLNDDEEMSLPEIGDWVADNLLKEE